MICSSDGIDPQDTRLLAEEKCLSHAAKLGGVEILINQKTVQSLTGADSSEISEVRPILKRVKCEWTDYFLEQLDSGSRVWLRCKVKKTEIMTSTDSDIFLPEDKKLNSLKYQRAHLTLTSAPTPDKVIIHGLNGERVIDTKNNVISLELKEGDHSITVKKHRFKDKTVKLEKWKHGDSLNLAVYLEQEI